MREKQDLQESLDFIREQFHELNKDIKRPHSLDADVLRAQLDDLEREEERKQALPVKRSKVYYWRPIAGIAACFVFVFGAVFLMRGNLDKASQMEAPATANEESAPLLSAEPAATVADSANEAEYASDYTQVRDQVFTLCGGYDSYTMADAVAYDAGMSAGAAGIDEAAVDDAVAEEAPMEAKSMPQAAADTAGSFPVLRNDSASDYSGTNVQEAGVDEADVVKTDGEYLYSFVYKNTTSKGPAIYIADADDMTLSSKIELGDSTVEEFYVSGNRLVTVGYNYQGVAEEAMPKQTIVEATDDSILNGIEKLYLDAGVTIEERGVYDDMASYYGNSMVETVVYDITDKENPKEMKTFLQDGDYTSSRLIDGTLYLVSNRYIYPSFDRKQTRMSDLIPVVYDSESQEAQLLPADKIAIAPSCSTASYAVVSTLDVSTGKVDTQAVLGGSDGVYMSTKNLYVYYTVYNDTVKNGDSYENTNIIRFSVEENGLKLQKTGMVPGYTDGQFAFSEYDGNLRVATTSSPLSGSTSNDLYVLDKNMRRIGELTGLAPGERIYSVRYMNQMAYLVTFRQIDPLFAVDLSDPKNPKLMGQLKIPGFSEYLHPVDKNTLIGIGHSTDQNGIVDGLKLSMFDVSDPLSPQELHVYNFGGASAYSEALSNHKAVMVNEKRSLITFPATVENQKNSGMENVYYIFSYDRDQGFKVEKILNHAGSDPYNSFVDVNRALYIGDILYAFSPDQIVSYKMDHFTQLKKLSLI